MKLNIVNYLDLKIQHVSDEIKRITYKILKINLFKKNSDVCFGET